MTMAKKKEKPEEVTEISGDVVFPECKVSMTKRIFNDLIGMNEEFTLEVTGDDLDECKKVFDVAVRDNKFEMEERWKKNKQ